MLLTKFGDRCGDDDAGKFVCTILRLSELALNLFQEYMYVGRALNIPTMVLDAKSVTYYRKDTRDHFDF